MTPNERAAADNQMDSFPISVLCVELRLGGDDDTRLGGGQIGAAADGAANKFYGRATVAL